MRANEFPSLAQQRDLYKVWEALGDCQSQLGKYAASARAYEESVAISQRVYGAEHLKVAWSLTNLANALDDLGQYVRAEVFYRQALELRKKLLGAEHLEVATSLNNLGLVLSRQSQYASAEELLLQALEMRKKLLGPEHLLVAQSMNNLAGVVSRRGQFVRAEALFRQALELRKQLLGPEHIDIAVSLNNLAGVHSRLGQNGRAEVLYEQALEMKRRLLGPEHPTVATGMNNLALEMKRQGKYARAEILYQQALEMRRKLLGPEHPAVAISLNNLAAVLQRQGQYERAEDLFQQALEMTKKFVGPNHPDVADSLNNIASVLESQGQFLRAEALYQQALEMRKSLLGAEHPEVADSLNNLAVVLTHQSKYKGAEALHQQTLNLRMKLLGSEHPDIADSLNNLAVVVARQGEYQRAKVLMQQALEMRKKLLGGEHPDVAASLNNLATLLLAQGQVDAAEANILQAARIHEGQLRSIASEAGVQAMLQALREEEDLIYGLLLGSAKSDATRRLALTTALLRKGRAQEAGVVANRLLHRNMTDPIVRQRFDDWQAMRQQRDALLFGGLGKLQPETYQTQLKKLSLQAQGLEAQLKIDLPEISNLNPPEFDDVLPAVAKRLPKKSVLVEIVRTQAFLPLAKDEVFRWGSSHYIVLLLFGDQRIVIVDLGSAVEMDARSKVMLAAMQNAASNPIDAAHELYRQLIAPLRPHLSGISDLYLSLDGTQNLIPFDALHDGAKYLLGNYRFHYLTSGRDLLSKPSKLAPRLPLVLANPDFGQVDKEIPEARPASLYQLLAGLPALPGTQVEAEILQKLLGVQALTGDAATEEKVRLARAPLILHIATHGLFLRDVDLPSSGETNPGRRGVSLFPGRVQSAAAMEIAGLPTMAGATNRSALLVASAGLPKAPQLPGDTGAMNRSALVLANVRQGHRARDTAVDGILTAEEARSLTWKERS